ncbi:putative mitochondrial carrier protein [Piedraia hortae CBS 480.64]|uniref:Mitochondrial thiamine pyrophosphate carrier 1 n=1 Tax=Piedraia hortae CBS 480.64 TaxID=1314780 RepID=A0A6A7C0I3_9PEZI|nr:putative mitochondrial carrier protein [Piedraia hortae CBS 480.64]
MTTSAARLHSDHGAKSGTMAVESSAQPSVRRSNQSLDYMARSLGAGGIAACAAKTVVAPLDRVKILFQASNPQFQKYTGSWSGAVRAICDIYRSDGGRGLFRGHSATLLRIFPYGGIKFMVYEQTRAFLIPSADFENPIRRLMAGALAGTVSVCTTYPLELVRVRLAWETQGSTPLSLVKICRSIYAEPAGSVGLANFYRGFAPTLLGMIPYAGMSFLTHDYAGDFMRRPALARYTVQPIESQAPQASGKPPPLTWWAELLTGAMAGFVSQTSSYPIEVIRRRMQVGGVVGDGHRLKIMEVARQIWQTSGWRGFFVGLGIGYVKVIPMVATSFFVYERMKIVVGI